jgi:hypothetical protein
MIKAVILAPFMLAAGLFLLFWLVFSIGSILLVGLILSPIMALFDSIVNTNTQPSKYANYGN